MVRNIRKSFLRSAVCFSVLCALGAGFCTGDLMASTEQQAGVTSTLSVGNVFVEGTHSDENLQLQYEDIQLQYEDKVDPEVVAIDFGTNSTEVAVCSGVSGIINLLNVDYKNKCMVNEASNVENLLIGQLEATFEPSYDECIDAICGRGVEHKFDSEYKYLMKANITSKPSYAMVPCGVMNYVKEDGEGIIYRYGSKEQKLTKDQYKNLKEAVQFGYMLRALRIWNQYSKDIGFTERIKKGAKIALTCSDSILGYEKECLLDAIRSVFENRGVDVLDLHTGVIKTVPQGSETMLYRMIPQSTAALLGYARTAVRQKPSDGKIVAVNYSRDGFSICGGKLNGGKITLHKDQYITNCGGKVINDAIVDLVRKRCDDKGVKAKFDKWLKKDKNRSKLLKEVENAKCLLSASGSNDAILALQFLEDNECDTILTRDQIKATLREKGIVQKFQKMFKGYINTNFGGELNANDRVVLVGGASRMSFLQEALKVTVNDFGVDGDVAQLCAEINPDEAAVCGAFYYGSVGFGKINSPKINSPFSYIKSAITAPLNAVSWVVHNYMPSWWRPANTNNEDGAGNPIQNSVGEQKHDEGATYHANDVSNNITLDSIDQNLQLLPDSIEGNNYSGDITVNYKPNDVSKDKNIIAIDFGNEFTKISLWEDGSANLLQNADGGRTFQVNRAFSEKDCLSSNGTKASSYLEYSYDECIEAVLNYKLGTGNYLMELNTDKHANDAKYAMVPCGIMNYVKDDSEGIIYRYGSKEQKLTKDQYKNLKDAVQFGYMLRALRIWNQNAKNDHFIARVKDGATISLTCGDNIQGYEKECLLKAIKSVFEAKGNVSSLGKVDEAKMTYRMIPQSTAALLGYARDAVGRKLSDGKIVAVNYSRDGFSICGGKLNGGKITLHKDQYITNCGGKVIDDAIVDLVRKRCDDKGVKAKFDKWLKKDKNRSQLLKGVENAKCLLSASGATEANLTLGFLEDNECDTTLTRDQIEAILGEKGIVQKLQKMFKDYITTNFGGELNANDRVVLVGGASRMPFLQEALKVTVNDFGALLCTDINTDEAVGLGATYCVSNFDMTGEKVSEISDISDISIDNNVVTALQDLINPVK